MLDILPLDGFHFNRLPSYINELYSSINRLKYDASDEVKRETFATTHEVYMGDKNVYHVQFDSEWDEDAAHIVRYKCPKEDSTSAYIFMISIVTTSMSHSLEISTDPQCENVSSTWISNRDTSKVGVETQLSTGALTINITKPDETKEKISITIRVY